MNKRIEDVMFWMTAALLTVAAVVSCATLAYASVGTHCECLDQQPHSANTECICHVPPSHDMTICVAPSAVAAHIAHGDTFMGHLPSHGEGIACGTPPTTLPPTTSTTLVDVTTTTLEETRCTEGCEPTTTLVDAPTTTLVDETTTTTDTTTSTTTFTEPQCGEIPILKDPAKLADGFFYAHGQIKPDAGYVVDGLGVTLYTEADGVFLASGCPLVETEVGKRWSCQNDEVTVRVWQRGYAGYAFWIKGAPPFAWPTSNVITTRVSFGCPGGQHTGPWKGTLGQAIRVRW